MKPIYLVRRHHIREMLPNDDTARMVASGDWVQLPEFLTRPPTPEAIRQRRCRARKRAARDSVTTAST